MSTQLYICTKMTNESVKTFNRLPAFMIHKNKNYTLQFN